MSIDSLVRDNYYSWKDNIHVVAREVKRFLIENDTVLGEHPVFIKRLTKVARKVHDTQPQVLRNLVEKLYIFNREGADIIHAGTVPIEQVKADRLRSHFYSYASDAAKDMYHQTADKHWALIWYDCAKKATRLSAFTDKSTELMQSKSAAEAAHSLYQITKDPVWLNNEVSIREYGYALRKNLTPFSRIPSIARFGAMLGRTLYIRFLNSHDPNDASASYELMSTALSGYKEEEQDAKMLSYRIKGLLEVEFFKRTLDSEWRDKAIQSLQKFTDYIKNQKKHSHHKYLYPTNDTIQMLQRYSWAKQAR